MARTGLAAHPNYPSARMTLGRALFDTGDLAAARGELELVLRGAPENILAEPHARGVPRRPGGSGRRPPAVSRRPAACAGGPTDRAADAGRSSSASPAREAAGRPLRPRRRPAAATAAVRVAAPPRAATPAPLHRRPRALPPLCRPCLHQLHPCGRAARTASARGGCPIRPPTSTTSSRRRPPGSARPRPPASPTHEAILLLEDEAPTLSGSTLPASRYAEALAPPLEAPRPPRPRRRPNGRPPRGRSARGFSACPAAPCRCAACPPCLLFRRAACCRAACCRAVDRPAPGRDTPHRRFGRPPRHPGPAARHFLFLPRPRSPWPSSLPRSSSRTPSRFRPRARSPARIPWRASPRTQRLSLSARRPPLFRRPPRCPRSPAPPPPVAPDPTPLVRGGCDGPGRGSARSAPRPWPSSTSTRGSPTRPSRCTRSFSSASPRTTARAPA